MIQMQALHHSSFFCVFTDGACSGNPGSGGWGAIILDPYDQVIELGGSSKNTTNNRMELIGIIEALEAIQNHSLSSEIRVFTDSTYLIQGITSWIEGWKKRGWVSLNGGKIANQDLWEDLDHLVKNKKISWNYVRGHSGIPGNERADQIAVHFSQGKSISLYSGPLALYPIRLKEIPKDTSLPEWNSYPSATKKSKPYSYLSLVGKNVQRHTTWSECEARIKGQSGAKFKKAMTAEEEVQILKTWGITSKKIPS